MEAELGALFEYYQKKKATRTALSEMGHQLPPTPVATDNIAANSIVNGTAHNTTSGKRARKI